ncbi:hypothetical protein GTQ40_15075 [Flavobacteriaceae bacterium R38]|nr:hypothetical protein [Flavobacteriaceae bacterium R38]
MRFFKNIFDFYLNASIHVALAVYILVQITLLNFDIDYDLNLSFVTFFGTIVIYNFIKYGSRAKKYFIVEKEQDKIIQVFSFLAGFTMLFFVFQLKNATWIGFLILGLISIFYVIPFHASKKNFRSLNGLKIYIVALVWSGVTVYLPILNAEMKITHDVLIEGIQRFLFVLVITLPFEIRDLQIDEKSLNTIPQQIGVQKTKLLGVILIDVFLLLELFKDDYTIKNLILLLIVKAAVIISLFFSKREQSKYYSSFYVESIPLIWYGVKVILMTNL